MSDVKRHDAIQGDIVHEYDGIEEADNRLPIWWLVTFFGAVAFGVFYWEFYEVWRFAPSTPEIYATEMAERLTAGGVITDEVLVTLSQDSTTVAMGQHTFETTCVACHGDHAQGNIGPNLTDDHWLHGGAPTDIFRTVHDGFTPRGMPQWGPVLGERGVQSVVAYVLTLRDTNVSGRAPEGEVYVPEETSADATPPH